MPRHSLNRSFLSVLCLLLALQILAVKAAPAGGPPPPPPVVEGQAPETSSTEVSASVTGSSSSSATSTLTSEAWSSTTESSSTTTESSSTSSSTSSSSTSSSTSESPGPTVSSNWDETDWEESPSPSDEPTSSPAAAPASSINISPRPAIPTVSIPPSTPRLPVTAPGAPVFTPGFGIPVNVPTSYAIAQPPVVTLQVVDGKLVPAAATTQYSIALPGATSAVGSAGNTSAPAAVGFYVNPLVGYASEIISIIPATCDRPCSSFKSHTTTCASQFPPLLSSSTTAPTANETKTDTELTKCLCDYTYQAQTCGQCFARNETLAKGEQMAYFGEIVKGCQAAKEGKSMSASNGTSSPASVMPSATGALDPATKLDALQGVDKELLGTICNATGLSKTNATAYESCKNGTNVAAILNTTDSALRQKLASMKNSQTGDDAGFGDGESVASYCDTVHFNDYFWSQTCHKESAASMLLRGNAGMVSMGVCVLSAGVWLLL